MITNAESSTLDSSKNSDQSTVRVTLTSVIEKNREEKRLRKLACSGFNSRYYKIKNISTRLKYFRFPSLPAVVL